MPEIKLNDVKITYKNKKELVTVFEKLNVVFESGKFSTILGFSGCGKTSILSAILDIIPYEGTITFDGIDIQNVEMKDLNISFVSQNYILYPHMSVFDNIAFPLKLIGAPRDEIIKRVYEIADELDIRAILSRKPKQISGGQQQRVAIARALVKRPSVCIFDEPLSNLDAALRMEARFLIKKLISCQNITAIYVTHDFNEAMALSDMIYIIDKGQIRLSGTPKEIFASSDDVVNSLKYNGDISDVLSTR